MLKQLPHNNRHKRELQALYSVAKIMATRSGQREMLLEILDVLDHELAMSHGTVMLLSSDGTELVVEAARNIRSDQSQQLRYRRGEGIIGTVIQTGKPAIVPRISMEPRFCDRIHRRGKQKSKDVSFVCVPITIGSEVVGTLSTDILYDQTGSLDEDERLLSIVSSIIANDVKARRTAKLSRQTLEAENLRLRDAVGERFRPENIIGNSKIMRSVYTKIYQVAKTDTTVLVRGESGTGKELVASAIHYSSIRNKQPFVKVNCAALNENLLESELFGHEKGAFTGALYTRIGRIEEAEGGTIFLDEIGDFSQSMQVKLLRVVQEREFERVGSNKTLKANVRIITATNSDLETAVKEGTFRIDLYYRINVFQISLPTLRDRKSDILLLANHFVEKYSRRMSKDVRRISTPAINMMLDYHWPGNVRELENCIEYAVLLSTDGVIHGHNLPPTLQTPGSSDILSSGLLRSRVMVLEKDMITDALKHSKGKIAAAAQELGITSRMLRYKIKKLKIDYCRIFK